MSNDNITYNITYNIIYELKKLIRIIDIKI